MLRISRYSLAALLGLAPLLASASAPHPHGRIPLLRSTHRARLLLATPAGRAVLHCVETRFRAACPELCAPPGAFADTLAAWARRGQVDLFQHVLATHVAHPVPVARAAEHIQRCEACRALALDAAYGAPPYLSRLAPDKLGILPLACHTYLVLERPRSPERERALPPATPAFLDRLARLSHAVPFGIAMERCDLDGDGTMETERLDLDDDGRFEIYHIDRDRDGAFELSAQRAADGSWRIEEHGSRLEELRRALRAVRPPSEKSGGAK